MKKEELKKMLKPLIKECIKEVMFEQGTLSTIVSEVVQGLGNPVISESRSTPSRSPARTTESDTEARKRREQSMSKRKQMLEAIGKDSYNGVDLFEGTSPAPAPSNASGRSALSGVDHRDPGIDISSLMKSSGNWKALVGK
jgi:hypothetical protein